MTHKVPCKHWYVYPDTSEMMMKMKLRLSGELGVDLNQPEFIDFLREYFDKTYWESKSPTNTITSRHR